MKQIFLVTSLLTLSISCSGDKADIYKTKSGLYGSRAGEFLIKFLGEPESNSLHYQAGQLEYDEFIFQYKVGTDRIYHVSYLDYPPELIRAWDVDQLFDQSIKNLTSGISDFKILERTENLDKDYDKSVTYILSSITPGNNTFMKAKLIMNGLRIYFVYFASQRNMPDSEQIDEFIDSFRIHKPKEST
ncbi:MAG: hypothetical protein RLO17_05345 [Cyclobacteriaceae bacterium]